MKDYFYCVNGDCEKCDKKPQSVFNCGNFGDCDFCIAKHTDFCEACLRFAEKSQK